jgi:hypothetical protein
MSLCMLPDNAARRKQRLPLWKRNRSRSTDFCRWLFSEVVGDVIDPFFTAGWQENVAVYFQLFPPSLYLHVRQVLSHAW